MNELVVKQDDWGVMKEKAATLLKTGFLPKTIDTVEKALAIAITGRELGIGMMESIRGINVILGKPCVSPQLMLALARRTKELAYFDLKSTPEGATCVVQRAGSPKQTFFFGVEQAKRLGLMGKDNYVKQAETMFKWRVVAEAMRFTFPDAISGLYTPDEMGADVAVTESGEMTVKEAPVSVQQPKEKFVETPIQAEIVNEQTGEVIQEKSPTEKVSTGPSDKAIKFYHLKRKAANLPEDAIHRFISMKWNKDHVSDLTKEEFTGMIKWLEELAETK